MASFLLRRVLPLLVLGGLSLTSCVVHEHDYGHRGRDRHHGPHRDYGYYRR